MFVIGVVCIPRSPAGEFWYSPCELLYGRTVRGPMFIVREFLTKKLLKQEVQTIYQYVIDLQNRLQETFKLVSEELQKAQVKQMRRKP